MPRYYRQPDPEYGRTEYVAVGDTPSNPYFDFDDEVDYPTAKVTVKHPSFEPNFRSSPGGLDRDSWLKTVGIEPDTLFSETPAEISSAFSHTSMRHSVPMLLAMAKREFPDVRPSSNLSPYSSRLTRKALDKGLVNPNDINPEAEIRNSADFDDTGNVVSGDMVDGIYGLFAEENIVPDIDVAATRHSLRHMLRPPKPHMGPQFDKHHGMDQIPGVDW